MSFWVTFTTFLCKTVNSKYEWRTSAKFKQHYNAGPSPFCEKYSWTIFFNGQNELKLNENNYLQIILYFKGEKDKKCDRKIYKNREACFTRSCSNRLYTVIINVKLAETNTFFSLRLPKIKPIICITRSKPEQHNFCRPTTFSLRVATVLKYFCLRDSFIIQIGVERKHLLQDNFFL